MRKLYLFLLSFCLISSNPVSAICAPERTKLIVQISLDQFKSDYLIWYDSAFKHGLRRVIDEGQVEIYGQVDHAITNSYPGHATLSTGLYPSNHGLIGNGWMEEKNGVWVSLDGLDGTGTHIVGQDNRSGGSLENLRSTTISDWVIENDKNAKSIALSSGTMISMLYGGKSANASYWLDRRSGKFVTSSIYRDEYPDWIKKFNEETLLNFKKNVWNVSVPSESRVLATSDASDYENFGSDYTFPYEFTFNTDAETSREEQYNGWFYNTPMADEALFALAQEAVTNEHLGEDESTDYLAVVVNTTDNIGHSHGGRSQEILDVLVRVDKALGSFLEFLDKKVGTGNYVVSISGDHGGPDVIEYQQNIGSTAQRVSKDEIGNLLDEVKNIAENSDLSDQELIAAIEKRIEQFDFVYDAITLDELAGTKTSDNPYLDLYRKSKTPDRYPDFPLWSDENITHHPAQYGIIVQFNENTIFHAAPVVHGSPYAYDRSVPIIFFGENLDELMSSPRTLDVAPTLATLAGITFPDGLDGKYVLKDKD